MLTDYSAVGEHAVGEMDAAFDASVLGALRFLLDDPDAALVFLLILRPIRYGSGVTQHAVDEDALLGESSFIDAAPEIFAVSDLGYQTGTAGSESTNAWGSATAPANTNFAPRLLAPLEYSVLIPYPGNDGSSFSQGEIVINNADGGLDGWLRDVWVGRDYEIKIGEKSLAYSEFETFSKGRIGAMRWDAQTVTLSVSDASERLQQPVQTNLYAGTGGLEGGAGLEGLPKPLLFGARSNLPLVLVDAVNRIYQVHHGSIDGVSAVRDNGTALAFDANVADISTATPAPGEYATSLATGLIKLGASAEGQVTADCTGDNAGGYVSTAAAIADRIVRNHGGFTSAEIDAGAINLAALAAPAAVGIWTGTNEHAATDLLNNLLANVGWWTFDRAGLFSVGVLDSPGAPSAEFDQTNINNLQRLPTAEPLKRLRLGYAKNAAVQDADGLAAALSDADRQRYSSEFLYVSRDYSLAGDRHKSARTQTIGSLINSKSDALIELDRLLARDRCHQDLYQLDVLRHLWQTRIGDTIRVVYPRFGLESGKSFRVVGISESASERSATLTLWG